MWQDIRLAVRGFRKTPVFTTVAIVTLALATGATTAVFTILNALTLQQLTVRDPQTLVQISGQRPGSPSKTGLTFRMYEEMKRGQSAFSAVLGWLDANMVNVDTGELLETAAGGHYHLDDRSRTKLSAKRLDGSVAACGPISATADP